jgi:hypothetical protein
VTLDQRRGWALAARTEPLALSGEPLASMFRLDYLMEQVDAAVGVASVVHPALVPTDIGSCITAVSRSS